MNTSANATLSGGTHVLHFRATLVLAFAFTVDHEPFAFSAVITTRVIAELSAIKSPSQEFTIRYS